VVSDSSNKRIHIQLIYCHILQAVRGGRTKLAHLTAPQADYQHEEKGDALHAMELALSLEKLNFHKLRELHDVADESNDAQMADFVEDMLAEQVWCFVCKSGMISFGLVWCQVLKHVCCTSLENSFGPSLQQNTGRLKASSFLSLKTHLLSRTREYRQTQSEQHPSVENPFGPLYKRTQQTQSKQHPSLKILFGLSYERIQADPKQASPAANSV